MQEHRAHRFGSLVEAAVLRQVVDEFPQVRTVSTSDADSNRPIVAVDEALGLFLAVSRSSWSLRL